LDETFLLLLKFGNSLFYLFGSSLLHTFLQQAVNILVLVH
jgi:hypothetical protein